MVLMLASMLHGIGVGNMLPSAVRVVCIDINPAVVTKLGDRGSSQTVGIVTDTGLFLHQLAETLRNSWKEIVRLALARTLRFARVGVGAMKAKGSTFISFALAGALAASAPISAKLAPFARQHNVTQIVIGKPLGSRWTSFLKRDPLRWLMRNSGNIDIHMIPADESAPPWRGETIEERLARAPWRDFGVALAIAAVVTAFSLSIFDYTGYWAFRSSICSRSFSLPHDYVGGQRFFSPPLVRFSGIFSSFRRASPFTSRTFTTS